jgi:hypothetical protein
LAFGSEYHFSSMSTSKFLERSLDGVALILYFTQIYPTTKGAIEDLMKESMVKGQGNPEYQISG